MWDYAQRPIIMSTFVCLAIAVIGGGIIGQQVCLALYKFGMPGLGGVFGTGFVFAWTYGIGSAAEAYFQSGMTMSREELERIRKQGEAEAEQNWHTEQAMPPTQTN